MQIRLSIWLCYRQGYRDCERAFDQ